MKTLWIAVTVLISLPGPLSLYVLSAEATQGLTDIAEASWGENLIPDPSFEVTQPVNRYGMVFPLWNGWIYGGDTPQFYASTIARTGDHSCLIVGGLGVKVRMFKSMTDLKQGRYRIRAYIRGLGITSGRWGQTIELAWNISFINLKKNGSFGWTPVEYVVDFEKGGHLSFAPSIGLMAPGFLWIDDVSLELVDDTVALTPKPVIGEEEEPLPCPEGDPDHRCEFCLVCNPLDVPNCLMCGTPFPGDISVPPTDILADFEQGNDFINGVVSSEHVSSGESSLMIEEGWAGLFGEMDWTGYDVLAIDYFTENSEPTQVALEIADRDTTGYWTRVNLYTVWVNGGTYRIPIETLFVGEKSRPGRKLILDAIKSLIINVGDPATPIFIDNVRLERDNSIRDATFPGLLALDCGSFKSPLMPGFFRTYRLHGV